MNREAFLSLPFLKSEEFPGRYYVTCWRSQSCCKPGNSTSETPMVTTIPSFLKDCVKRHFLVARSSLTNRLITHECVCLVGPVWLGRALGQCFQLEVCEPFCLWILFWWKETYIFSMFLLLRRCGWRQQAATRALVCFHDTICRHRHET